MTENWDEHAETWDKDEQVRAYSQHALASLFEHVDVRSNDWKSKRVLDFGCGTGLLTEKLAPFVGAEVAVDTSKKMIEALKGKQLGNVTALCADIDDCDVRRSADWLSRFDLIVASSVCSFLPDYEFTIGVLSRALAPKGFFVQWDWQSSGDSFGLTKDRIMNAFEGANLKCVCVEPAFAVQANEQNMPVLIGIGAARPLRVGS